jgi:hypothetical protein
MAKRAQTVLAARFTHSASSKTAIPTDISNLACDPLATPTTGEPEDTLESPLPQTTSIPKESRTQQALKRQTSSDYTYTSTVYSNTVTIYFTSPYLSTSVYSSTEAVDTTTTETETSTEVLNAQETVHTTTTRVITGTKASTSSSEETSTSFAAADANSGLSTGAKAGIGAGAGAGGLLIIAGLLTFCIRKRRREKRVSSAPEHDTVVALGGPASTSQKANKSPAMTMAQSPAPSYGTAASVYAMHQKPELHSTPSTTHASLAQPVYGVHGDRWQYQAYSPGGGLHTYSPEMPASPVPRHSLPEVDGRGMSPGSRSYGAPPQLGQYSPSQLGSDGYPPGYFR